MNALPNQIVTSELLHTMRAEADPVADQVIARLFVEGNVQAVTQLMASISRNGDLLPAALPEPVRQFFADTAQLPEWADRRRMAAGAAFFARHLQPVLSTLGSLSLPYCYAAADGAQVLYLSERIRKNTRRRLAETGQFVLDVMDKRAFDEKGAGLRSIQKVRLMHATVRFHILQSGQWNEAWGTPVNQEDMAGTNLSLSYIVLEGLQKLGIRYTSEEATDYLHVWNVVGYLLGVRPELLPATMKEAYWLDKRIAERNFRKSEAGVELTKSLLRAFDELAPNATAREFAPAYMRFLLGDKVSDLLELPQSNWTAALLSPLKAINVARSSAQQLSRNSASAYASNVILQIIRQEGGRATFAAPASLKESVK